MKAPNNIHVNGCSVIEAGVVIHSDLANVSLGEYCIVGNNSVIQPYLLDDAYSPVSIGDFVCVEKNCVVQASEIGSCVLVSQGSVISQVC